MSNLSEEAQLYDEQKKAIEKLGEFIRNYKADPKIRKKEITYYEKKLRQLEEWWVKFDANNTKIMNITDVDKTSLYFEENSFERAKDVYMNQRTKVQDDQKKLQTKLDERARKAEEKKSTTAAAASQSTTEYQTTTKLNNTFVDIDSIAELIESGENDEESEDETSLEMDGEESLPSEVKVYIFQWKELKKAVGDAENVDMYASHGTASAQLENVKMLWNEFRTAHRNIAMIENGKHCKNMDVIQSRFFAVISRLNDIVHGNSSKQQSVQLPKIKLPEFDGKPSNWRAFKDLYDKIVHFNHSISNEIKAQYLKSNLTGAAAKLVEHLSPTEANYKTCYELLCNRYENEREIVTELIDKILDLEIQKNETSDGLKLIHDKTFECIMSIESAGTDVTNWDVLLIQILMRKLNQKTIMDYESKLSDVKKNQTLAYFLKYLENRFLALLSAETKTKCNVKKVYDENKQKREVPFQCTYCEHAHSVYKCDAFVKLEPTKRYEWAKEKKICFVCLQGHSRNDVCKSKYNCRKCGKKHNTLLHMEKKVETKSLIATTENNEKNEVSRMNEPNVSTLIASARDENNLLATAMVRVAAKNGDKVLARAVIDMGSQSSMVTANTQQALALKTEKIYAGIDGVEAVKTTANKCVELKIFPRFSDDVVLISKALVMKKITNLSVFKDDLSQYEHLQNLQYADPTVNSDKPIDILLGVADYARILKTGLIKGPPDAPIAQNSELGWLIMGPNNAKNEGDTTFSVTSLITNLEINEKMSKIFDTSEIDDDDSEAEDESMTEEEKFCEEHFLKTTKRDAEGRFIVSLPFKNNREPVLGDSKKAALAVLFQLEKRFQKNPKLKSQYSAVINEEIEKGYLKLVEKPPKNAHYIPHHAVFKDSTTTKLRTVYNASQPTKNGKSLNEQLAMGKIVQPTMFELSLRWRTYKISLVADIEKMYKQIKLDEKQQHLQMVLWRDEEHEKIREYKMTTVTFGVSDSPYLAIRWLKALADAVASEYPLASNAIKSSFYVDDHTGGAPSEMQAIELYKQLKATFLSAGCNLRKFISNSPEVLNSIPEEDREMNVTRVVKVLGIIWNPTSDELEFKFNVEQKSVPKTRRQLISEIASIYDPLGLLTPVVVKAKILVQEVWSLSNEKEKKYGWDDQLPKELIEKWMKIKLRAKDINTITVPRWLKTSENSTIQIHGFCDASEKAYAACVYVKVTNENNEISTNLLTSKTKNSSSLLTSNKLELCGAKLLSKLVKKVRKATQLNVEKTILWCDSRVVLSWIAADPRRYRKFVSSRVISIQRLKNVTWCHIPGTQNPADCASRGIYGDELKESELWWHGPEVIQMHNDFEQFVNNECATNIEIKPKKINALLSAIQVENFLPQMSSFYKLKKVMSFVLRFVNNCRNNDKRKDRVTVNEIRSATTAILKITQNETFIEEIKCLENNKSVCKKSKLFKLDAFLDGDQLLRVGGRLKNANLAYDAKHQIILPKNHEITTLIINEAHKSTLHGGPKLTESTLRQKYWVIDSKSAIKRELRKCIVCAKNAPKTMNQFMGNLPKCRVNRPFKLFMNASIDYAGPFIIKSSSLRNSKTEKAYVSVFVCMATKAIHLELVSNLTADNFIAALRRFVSRRGKISTIFSDNGTNFVKSNKILHSLNEAELEQYQSQVDEELLSKEIEWKFAPPGSPHHNGLAEAAVKSMKFHLKRALGEKVLTFEEMCTLLCQIEAVVNSRPICEMSTDPCDMQTLTPAHFLNMVPMELAPDEDLTDVKTNYLSRWQVVQKIFQNFWTQWKQDYLNQLQVRQKWNSKEPNIKLNELVMIRDDNLPSTKWSTGRVIATHPGDDGFIRVATVKTANNTLKRAVTKLAPLPIVTTLLTVLFASLHTTDAHKFTIFKNAQTIENHQNVTINMQQKEAHEFANLTIIAIFVICFFAFLIFLFRILYRGLPTQTQSTHNASTIEAPIQLVHTQAPMNDNAQKVPMQAKIPTHSQQFTTQNVGAQMHLNENVAQMQWNENIVSPIARLEREYYESRRASFTAIYPQDQLNALREKIN